MTRRHVVTPLRPTSRPPGDLEAPQDRALRLAGEFHEFFELLDPKPAQWGPVFDAWAAGLRLTPTERRSTRIAVIVKRNFSSEAR